ncbi:MAG: 5-(carboxyamino)imidazole ribonucleotide synthase, partial [Flavobacteriales bacterium]
QGDLNDAEAVIAWGRTLDVVTVEIENVSIEGLTALKAMGVQVLPDPSHLALIRDKGTQKEFYASHGIPTSDFALVEDGRAEVLSRGLPVVQKLRTGGYDGRGVQVIRTEADATDAFDAPSVLEDAVDIDKELSVIVARSTAGEVKTYPVVESVFNELNLVDYLVAPARISEAVADEARRVALSVVEAMDFVGLLAIELFLDTEGRILVNEAAPRAHNSGHHTIEACGTSQFEQHLRAILGLPLGDTSQWTAAAMLNLIGAPDASGAPVYPGFGTALAEPGLHPHIYGKAAVRPGRKMGHVTLLAETADAAEQRVKDLRDHISTVHAH